MSTVFYDRSTAEKSYQLSNPSSKNDFKTGLLIHGPTGLYSIMPVGLHHLFDAIIDIRSILPIFFTNLNNRKITSS